MEGLYRAQEGLEDQVGGFFGKETKNQRISREKQQLQGTYQSALDDGRLKLQPGVEKDDLMAYLQTANLTNPEVKKGLDDFLVRTPPPPGQVPEKATPAGVEPGGTAPVKSVQEQDLKNFQQLQALEKIKKDAAEKPVDKQIKSVVDSVKPPVPPPPPPPPDGNMENPWKSDYIASQIVDKFGGIQDPLERQKAIANYLRNLKNAEQGSGSGKPPVPGKSGGGSDVGLQLALKTNVTGSLQQTLDQLHQQETLQALGLMRGTQADRDLAAQNQQMQGQSQVLAQGQLTSQAIANNALEFINAQQTLQVTRQNSLGNILMGGLMGGLTSGVAIGLDNFFWGTGRGAGQQVSTNWGISPLPPTHINTNDGTTSQTGGSTSSGTGPVTTNTGTTGTTTSTTVKPPPTPTSGGIKPPPPSGSGCRSPGICPRPTDANRDNCCDRCGKSTGQVTASAPIKTPSPGPGKPISGGPVSGSARW